MLGPLAVLDGGIREFFESPRKAWEPAPGYSFPGKIKHGTVLLVTAEEHRALWARTATAATQG